MQTVNMIRVHRSFFQDKSGHFSFKRSIMYWTEPQSFTFFCFFFRLFKLFYFIITLLLISIFVNHAIITVRKIKPYRYQLYLYMLQFQWFLLYEQKSKNFKKKNMQYTLIQIHIFFHLIKIVLENDFFM